MRTCIALHAEQRGVWTSKEPGRTFVLKALLCEPSCPLWLMFCDFCSDARLFQQPKISLRSSYVFSNLGL